MAICQIYVALNLFDEPAVLLLLWNTLKSAGLFLLPLTLSTRSDSLRLCVNAVRLAETPASTRSLAQRNRPLGPMQWGYPHHTPSIDTSIAKALLLLRLHLPKHNTCTFFSGGPPAPIGSTDSGVRLLAEHLASAHALSSAGGLPPGLTRVSGFSQSSC